MGYRPLDVTLISAKEIKDVNFFTKMDVYAFASISGDPRTKQRTPVDKEGGTSPTWNFSMRFNIDEAQANQNRSILVVQLRSDRVLGDRNIGEVHVPIKELLDNRGGDDGERFVSYQVRKPNGKAKGVLNLSYKFREKISAPVGYGGGAAAYGGGAAGGYGATAGYEQPIKNNGAGYGSGYDKHENIGDEPVTAYPAGSSGGYPPPAQPYAAPPPSGGYSPAGYPPAGYRQPPPNAGYGQGYPPPPQGGYGYPPQGGYGHPPQGEYVSGYLQQQQAPKRKNKFGMGLGAGLLGGALGGMLIGDMVSDGADYDAGYDGGGYDGGFDDGGGFDM